MKGKTTIRAVYKRATHTKKEKVKNDNRNKIKKIDALHNIEQKRILTDKYSILFQQNQLIQEKYDNVVQSLKKILTDIKTDDGDIEIKFNRLLEKLETLIDEINNPHKEKKFNPSLSDLRKAELKIN